MSNQTILLTVIPRAVSVVTDTLPVSVFVSPRLTGAPALNAYPDWLEWTKRLQEHGFRFTVDANGHTMDAHIDPRPLRPDLWKALFSAQTLVDDYVFSDYSGRTIISYPVRDAMLAVKSVYQQAAKELGQPADPNDKESGPRRAGLLTSLLNGFQLDEWSDHLHQRLRSVFGQSLDHPRAERRLRPAAPVGADGLPSAAQLTGMPEDLLILKQQVGSEFALYSRMPSGAPIVKPDMEKLFDFHKAISALNAYPALLRALGLVFDLDLPADGVPFTTGVPYGRLAVSSAKPGWQEFSIQTDLRPVAATAYQYLQAEDGHKYWYTPQRPLRNPDGRIMDYPGLDPEEWCAAEFRDRGRIMGLLELDPDSFCLAQFDVDGAMHKLMTLAAGVPSSGSKLSPALHPTKFDDANTLPSLRSAGISLIQGERARALLASIAASKRFNDRLNGNLVNDCPLFVEDLVRGYRLDVWDSFDNTWRSLHRRMGSYAFDEVEFTTEEEEGFTQLAVVQPAPDPERAVPNNDLYLHEAVARWGGWSLSVPPPGKAISRGADPDPQKAIPPDDPNDRDPDDRQNEPLTPFHMKVTYRVTRHSLPSLRFGRRYRVRVRVVDLAGNSLAPADPLANEITRQFAAPNDEAGFAYLRYEPVPAPQILRRDDFAITGPGSALDRLVIRTYNSDESLDGKVPDLSGSDRHIVPPRASIELAERHGMLDDDSGRLKGDAVTYQMLVQRDDETGSQFPSATVPGQNEKLPIVAAAEIPKLPYVPDPLARYAALRDLPGAKEHSFGRVAGGSLAYDLLADPNPRPGSVTQVSFDNAPDWLMARGFRMALAEGDKPPAWDGAQRLLTVFLPKGSTSIVPLSSAPTSDDLKLLGLWQWLREYLTDVVGAEIIPFGRNGVQEEIAALLQSVVEGGHWMLTPPKLLTLVSAVQQPLGRPRFEALAVQRANPNTFLQPLSLRNRLPFVGGMRYDPTPEQMEPITAWRAPGALDAYLIGALRIHGETTTKVDLFAEWQEWIDDPDLPEVPPVLKGRSSFVDTLPIHDASEYRLLMAPGENRAVGVYDSKQNLIGFTTRGDVFGRDPALLPEGDAAPRHYLGDTRHRRITYTAVATSRYRDYFPQDQDLDFTRISAPVEVNVPASARPPLASVRYVLPTFGWERQTSTNLVRSVRYGGGVRVYLDRSWHESGEGELLGVVLGQIREATDDAREAWKLFVTQWGRDPIWRTQPVWPQIPGIEHFPLAVAAESDLRLGESVPAGDGGRPGSVSVAGHAVAFDPKRKLWYCDIVLDCPSYSPFVRLALVRYQPNAIAEAKLSRVVLTDFVQLTPDRSVLVSADPYHPKELRLSVTGAAPDGPAPEAPGELPARPTRVRVRVQHRPNPERGEFGWHDVDVDTARVRPDTTDSEMPGVLLWKGRVIFTNPPESGTFRLLIEEREYISADHVATSIVNGFQVDSRNQAPGRIIYAEVVSLDDALTVVPAQQAATAALPEEAVGGGVPQGPGEVQLTRRVIVQLREGVEIPYADGTQQVLGLIVGPAWDAVLAAFPFLTLDRLFNVVEPADLDTVFNRAAAELGSPWPALQKFFAAICPPDIDPESVALALRAFSQVFERVYVQNPPALPSVDFSNDPHVGRQFYLQPAPVGFDVKFAWTQPGGDGEFETAADVERNWNLDHEDLRDSATKLISDPDPIPFDARIADDHGTSTIGVIVMGDNQLGGVGIAPRARMLLSSVFVKFPNGTSGEDAARAIMAASAMLEFGSVLLIELESHDFLPLETDPACFSAIAAATARGITVIEPGGNGPGNGSLGRFFNLDTVIVSAFSSRALARPPEGLESGAVIVAACRSGQIPATVARAPTEYSPRGRRIDCFGYGDHVFSASDVQPLDVPSELGGPPEPNPLAGAPYTNVFAGTSSASALIAGVAISVQGIAKGILKRRLSPDEMRQVLGDRTLNTPSANPTTDRIGVMPDLRKITDFLKTLKASGSIVSGTWVTVRTGHELVYLGRRLVLDWVPADRTFNVWPYRSLAIGGDPLPAPAVKSGIWRTIETGHTLIYMGTDLVLDYVPATGGYRLFEADWTKPDFLPGPARAKGTWATIRDEVVGGVLQQHRLVYLVGDRVLDWIPQDRTFRVWKLDRFGTRQDPLLGIPVAGADGLVHDTPLQEGTFSDPNINGDTTIITISANEVLFWHADTGRWEVLFYDRTLQSPQPFTDSPRSGTWNTIRKDHVLLWLGELGNGQLLDWEPSTGKYRLFSDIPLNA